MHISIEAASNIITYLVFIFLGYKYSKRIGIPLGVIKWIALVLATLISMFVKFTLFDVFNFTVQSNWLLNGLGLGIIIGLLTKMIKTKPVLQ